MSKESLKDIKPVSVPVLLDKPRNIAFNFNALAELEDLYGTIEDALDALASRSFKAVRAFVWAGLIHEDPTLTLQQVGQWSPGALLELNSQVMEAMGNALPKGEEKNVAKAPAETTGA